jgi:hypothetical protein
MRRIRINPLSEFVEISPLLMGEPGSWHTSVALKANLLTHDFDGMKGEQCQANDGLLYLDLGFFWNGSDFVKDTPECTLGSMLHDALCEMIEKAKLGFWKQLLLRRRADKIYAKVCKTQGMWTWRARWRYIGLRIGGRIWGMLT